MAYNAEEGEYLLLVSYSTSGESWEEIARDESVSVLEDMLGELPTTASHYSIVMVEDSGTPHVGEETGDDYED
jgi:hypothetical protein